MTTQNTSLSTPASIATETRYLAAHCRGPAAVTARLHTWADGWEAGAAEAYQLPILLRTAEDLVVLSHSNAGFRLAPTQGFYWGRPAVEIFDAGGYLAAQNIIKDLVATAPLNDESRSALIRHVLSVVDRHMRQLETLLSRH